MLLSPTEMHKPSCDSLIEIKVFADMLDVVKFEGDVQISH